MRRRIELRLERRITSLQAGFSQPAWSSRGRLALASSGPGEHGIYLVDGKGRLERLLVAEAAEPSWSRDGQWLAFTRNAARGERSVWVCQHGQPEHARCIATGRHQVWEHPAWSPDGQTVACVSDCGTAGGLRQIWVIDVASGERRRITCDPQRNDGHPSWSPDGRMLAFDGDDRADEAREIDVYVIELQSGAITRLSDGLVTTRRPTFIDRRFLLAERRTPSPGTGSLVVIDRAKKRLIPVAGLLGGERHPELGPITKKRTLRVAFVRRDETTGRDAVWLGQLHGLKLRAAAKQAAHSEPLASDSLPVLPPPPPGAAMTGLVRATEKTGC